MTEKDTAKVDTYYTILSRARAEQKVSGSKFIATAIPIVTKEQATEAVDELRREFFDATHNCYAYRIGIHGLEFRASDDGEPNGTAGKPILFAIQKYALSDTLVVVTRYFGGTKLGRGGLARAYASTAELVLAQCMRSIVYRTNDVKVFCTYEDLKLVLPIIEKTAVHITSDYRDAIEFDLKIMISQIPEFVETINRVTNARAGCVVDRSE